MFLKLSVYLFFVCFDVVVLGAFSAFLACLILDLKDKLKGRK